MSKAAPLSFEFAFEGFRIIRERPKLIAFWGLLSLIGNGLAHILLVQTAGHNLVSLFDIKLQDKPVDPAVLAVMVQPLIPAFAGYLLISLVMSAILSCAVFRCSTGEENDRLGFLKFGLSEINIIIVSLATFLVMLGVALFSGILGTLLGVVLAPMSNAAPAALMDVSLFFAILAMLYVQVRLSLNMAQTFATGRLNVFGSVALTRDVFWSLLTGYALAFALTVIVAYLAGTVVDAVLEIIFQVKATQATMIANMGSLDTFLTPSNVVFLVMSYGVVSPLLSAIIIGAPMAAYKALGGDGAAMKAESAAS